MRPEFARVSFQDWTKAEANLARLGDRLAPALSAPLASLLGESPDPDGALNLLERYAASALPQTLADLARHPTGLTYLVAIFGYSRFLAETLLAEPGLAVQFARDRNFTKLKSKEDLRHDYARFSTTHPDPWLSSQLARFKRSNYIRIVLKDVLRLSTLGETTLELSELADVILHEALTFCDQELANRYGHPQYRDAQGRIVRSGFAIISLGKLGGNELNYSSDIDLIFLYGHDGETSGGSEPHSVISNKEYFVRLAHAVTRTITQGTPQGEVFRVDLRLRPEGEQGDLAVSLRSALEYYEDRARDWELQMLIKARHSAGDTHLARQFLHAVEPSVYGTPADIEAVESVLLSRQKISKKLKAGREHTIDVKLDRGGIRDIEFLTQCLQRLHGGRDAWVRSGGTFFALRKLNDKGWLSDRDCADLTAGYEFLRKVEHRIQLARGQQTHQLPTDPGALGRLARRVGVEAGPTGSGAALIGQLNEIFKRVDEIYQRLIHPHAVSLKAVPFDLKPQTSWSLDRGPHFFESLLVMLDAQAPELAGIIREADVPERARANVTRLFTSLLSSSERFRLARQQPERVRRALQVVAASDYLAELLVYNPEDISALETSAPLGVSPEIGSQMEMALDSPPWPEPFSWVSQGGIAFRDKMALLRRQYRSRVVGLGAADVAGVSSIFTALGRWSALATRAISSGYWMAADALGHSQQVRDLPMAVLGLGRLGLHEFDLASDADLVFVAAAGLTTEEMSLSTRLAEKTIEVLSSYTRDGSVLAVDTRLRPQGEEGELVVSDEALVRYLRDSAGVWEVMTYLKAAPVAGHLGFSEPAVSRITEACLDRFVSSPDLEGKLLDMRRRLEREVPVPPSNTKTAPGGYYDVDFVVSYLRLRRRVALRPGANMAAQIAALRSGGLVSECDAQILEQGAAFLRSVDHAIRLATGRAANGLPEHVRHADSVEAIARHWELIAGTEVLSVRLRETQRQVRSVYGRLLRADRR